MESVYAPKSIKLDPVKRIEALDEVGLKLCPDSNRIGKSIGSHVERFGILFEFVECRRSGRDLICTVYLTSKSQDRNVVIAIGQKGGIRDIRLGQTNIADDRGNDYTAQALRFGSSNAPNTGQLGKRLVADVRTPAVFTFENIDSQAQNIKVLELHGAADDNIFLLRLPSVPIAAQ